MSEPHLDQVGAIFDLFDFSRIFLLFLGMAIMVIIAKAVGFSAHSLNRIYPSHRLLIAQLKTILNFCLYIFGSFFLFYGVLKPPQALLIATGGSVAVAVGLSLKDLAASVVAGLILLFDRPFQVGDRVTFGNIYGEIKNIGLRAVQLVTLDDSLVTIPNSRFLTDAVASGNAGALDMLIQSDFYVALDADISLARQLLFDIVATSRFVYLKKPINIVISEEVVAYQIAVRLRLKAYVLDVRFEKAFQTDTFVRANEAFRENKILRPRFSAHNV